MERKCFSKDHLNLSSSECPNKYEKIRKTYWGLENICKDGGDSSFLTMKALIRWTNVEPIITIKKSVKLLSQSVLNKFYNFCVKIFCLRRSDYENYHTLVNQNRHPLNAHKYFLDL